MMTQLEEKYYRDITDIRKSLNRIAEALETQNKINASIPIMQELMSRYDSNKILLTDEITMSGLASVALKYSDQLLNAIKDDEQD